MQIATTQHDTVLVLAVAGSVDSLSADALTQCFAEAIDAGAVRLVVDLGQVSYTSSAGLRVLLGAVKRCRLAGGDLRLAALQPSVLRVLEIAGFTNILNIFADVPAALASFGGAT